MCFRVRRISSPPLWISYCFGNGSRATRGTLRVGTPGLRRARPGSRQGERARAPLTCPDDSQTVRKKVSEREGVVSKKVSSASWPAVARASRRLPRELRETHAPLSSRKQPRRRGRTRGPPRMECFWTVTCRPPPRTAGAPAWAGSCSGPAHPSLPIRAPAPVHAPPNLRERDVLGPSRVTRPGGGRGPMAVPMAGGGRGPLAMAMAMAMAMAVPMAGGGRRPMGAPRA